jgi:hypothetical protein
MWQQCVNIHAHSLHNTVSCQTQRQCNIFIMFTAITYLQNLLRFSKLSFGSDNSVDMPRLLFTVRNVGLKQLPLRLKFLENTKHQILW